MLACNETGTERQWKKNTRSYNQRPVTLAALGSNLYFLLYLTYTTPALNQEGDYLLSQILCFIRI